MRIFISAGEPSGDLHGANLARALQRLCPDVECVGFGGEHMEAAGCRLLYPLSRLAVMWFARVAAKLPTFLRALSAADRSFRHARPDAVVLIDFPGFNWWVARRAHFHDIPTVYFVPPQLWAWAGWRVRKMRRWVRRVLCCLPFEVAWYRDRGVEAEYVGHPYFDELPQQRLDERFVEEHQARPGRIVGLLPGSRTQEVERNLSTLVETARRVLARCPDTRFLVACYRPQHRQYVEAYLAGRGLPITPFSGRTPEIIHLSHCCVAVSGSVGLELLYRGKPACVVYRIQPLERLLSRPFITARYISLVNLLADAELFPEYLTDRCAAGPISEHVIRWLTDEEAYRHSREALAALRQRVAGSGACERAARQVLELAQQGKSARRRSA
ncbi:MAG: lipid-A-disaccharide synthase [Gemmataceae bacterium]|nr:lipid-A-disaccharide synthase [Gemmataceae bacterium]MDW8263731.1 lipid-A-disaccharide synthase [Gemmataceae bacterium]